MPAVAAERLIGRAHVIDADTVVVAGIHVRLKGVAAPEVAHAGKADEPAGDAARAFMTALIEGQTVVCDLTRERTHGRRVGYCYRNGQDIAAGLARDCPRFSAGRYAELETEAAASLPFPGYCRTR
ncbi:MAG: thermonuclease family protein [Geminicoccaceae bacterium]